MKKSTSAARGRAIRIKAAALGLMAAAILLGSPDGLRAQTAAECTYATCAMRLEGSFFGTRLVQGEVGVSVAKLGMFAPSVESFEQRSELAGRLYEKYGTWHNRSTVVAIAATVLFGVSAIAQETGRDSLAIGTGLGGVVGLVTSGLSELRARNRLSRAVWTYNQTFADPAVN